MKFFNLIATSKLITVSLVFIPGSLFAQYYPEKGEWQQKAPAEAGMNDTILQKAVDFALANEYSGSRDLRVAIHSSFGFEPYDEIVGPTRERGGPAGIILKDGYMVARWGDIHRVDMTFSVTKSYLSSVVGLALPRGGAVALRASRGEWRPLLRHGPVGAERPGTGVDDRAPIPGLDPVTSF